MAGDKGILAPPPQLVTLWWMMARLTQPISLPDQLAARVGERIITGAIVPGARITEQEISEEYGVSRAPVRDSLRILERQHLAEFLPRRGARATLITDQGVRDLAEVRIALYDVIGRRLAGRGDPEAILKLESKAQDLLVFAEDSAGPDRYLWGALDLSGAMGAEVGNTYISEILSGIALVTYRYARLSALNAAQRQRTARMWRDAVRSMKRLDQEGAAAALRHIAEFARDRALEMLPTLPRSDPE